MRDLSASCRPVERLPGSQDVIGAGDTAPWSLDPDAVAAQLRVSGRGLGADEAARRLIVYGPNALAEAAGHSRLGVLWNQVRSPLLLLLFFAAGASVATGQWVDAAIVLGIVGASVGVGYSREYRAQTA